MTIDYKLPKIPEDIRAKEDSVAFLTMHKAGSSVANRIFQVFAAKSGYTYADFAASALKVGISERDYCVHNANLLSMPGYYFGPFRGIYVSEMGDFRKTPLIIQVRDPRDCACSNYYSISKSHVLPPDEKQKEAFMQMRDQMKSRTIDEYGPQGARNYLSRMTVLNEIISSHPNVTVIKYEDMVTNTDRWLDSVGNFFGISDRSGFAEELAPHLNFKVDEENPNVHKRQVTPGDHTRKMSAKTISIMNDLLEPALRWFDYPKNVTESTWA